MPKQVFTVKLASDLVRRLKTYARVSQRTLSSLVTQALEEFLGKVRAGPHGRLPPRPSRPGDDAGHPP